MKKRSALFIASLAMTFVFGISLLAQETTEITIQVKKDGKVVKDTTYQFEDASEAKHAMKMMEMLSGEEKHMEHYEYTMAHSGEGHSKTMVFISEDGENTVIKEMQGDSLVWIEEGDHPHEAHSKGEHVIVMKSGDGETFDILIDEDGDHDCVKKKNIKVIVSGDEEGTWTVDSNELVEIDEDENVIVIKNKDGDVDLEKIMEEHEGENVKIIVIKESEGEDGEEEVEVKVIEKKEKKEKK